MVDGATNIPYPYLDHAPPCQIPNAHIFPAPEYTITP